MRMETSLLAVLQMKKRTPLLAVLHKKMRTSLALRKVQFSCEEENTIASRARAEEEQFSN